MKQFLFFCSLLLAVIGVSAQTNTWTGAVSSFWSNSGNWTLGLPNAAHDVVIPSGSVVIMNTANSAKSVSLQGNATFTMSGTLSFTAESVFEAGTTVNWSNGDFSGGGTLQTAATIIVSAASNKSLQGGTTLNNSGTFNMGGSGELYLTNGTFNNLSGGVFEFMPGSGGITYSSGASHVMTNGGSILLGAAETKTINALFTNTGTITVTAGQLSLNSGLGSTLNGGMYNTSPDGIIRLAAAVNLAGALGGVLDGQMVSAASLNVPTSASLNFSGAGSFNWQSGSLSGGGNLTNNAKITLESSNNKFLNGASTITNNATIVHLDGGELYLTDGILTNAVSGLYDSKANSGGITYSSGANHRLNNLGTIAKTGVGTFTLACEIVNSGTLNAVAGTLTLSPAFASKMSGGSYNVSSGAIMNWSAAMVIEGALGGVLDGPLNSNSAINVLPGAPASFNFSGSTGFVWLIGNLDGGGVLTNNSPLRLDSANNKFIYGSATLINNSGMTHAGTGNLYLTAGTFSNTLSGTYELTDTGGVTYSSGAVHALNNAGLIRKNGSGTVILDANLTNTGTIESLTGSLNIGSGLGNLFDGGTYNVSSGASMVLTNTVTLNGALNGALNGLLVSNANLRVAPATNASFNFTGTSGLQWNSASLVGGGTLANNSVIDLVSANNKSIIDGTVLNNNAIINHIGAGELYITNGTCNNTVTAVYDSKLNSGGLTYSSGPTHLFNNLGMIKKSQAGTFTIGCLLQNSGTIAAETGTVNIASQTGGSLNGGNYDVAAGAVMGLIAPITVSGTLTGTLNGPLNWNTVLHVDPGNPAAFDFDGSDSVIWLSGSLDGGGTLTNRTRFAKQSSNNTFILDGSTLANSGTFTMVGPGELYLTNGTLDNLAGGSIDLQGGGFTYSSGPVHAIFNAGTIVHTMGSTFSVLTSLTNSGVIDSQSGTLNFASAIFLNNTVDGKIMGNNTVTLPSNPANFTNDGTFAPGGSPGKLTVIGFYRSSPSSVLEVELNGLTSETEYDLLSVTGPADFSGTIAVILGFQPAINDSFTVATTSSAISGFNLPPTVSAIRNGLETTFGVANVTNNKVTLTVTAIVAVPPITQDQAFCAGATVADLEAGGQNVQWYANAAGGSPLDPSVVLASGIYYATQTIDGFESTREPANIIITTTSVPTASSPQVFSGPATVADLTAAGTNIQWYAAATGGTALASNTALASGTYYVSQTADGCESMRLAVQVTVNTTPDTYPFYVDADGDGFGAGDLVLVAAPDANTPPTGYALDGTDCDDNDNTVYQSASLFIDGDGDGYDNGSAIVCYGDDVPPGYLLETLGSDCDDTDADVFNSFSFFVDADGDGFGSSVSEMVCAEDGNTPPAGYALNNTDCDDNDNTAWQSAELYIDNDGDGYDDGTATVCYGATIPDGYAQTTEGTDCDDNNDTIFQSVTLFVDADGDGYDNGTEVFCSGTVVPVGYSDTTNGPDCDDTDNTVWQSAELYVDADGDGYDNGSETICYGASVPSGYAQNSLGTDCDDNNPLANPGAAEIAGNGIDDNCNGFTDEGGDITTMVAANACGSTLGNINSLVGIVSYPGATAYRVRATNTATLVQQTIVRTVPNFKFPAFANYDYAATYSVDIEVQLNGVWVGYYGPACNVSTPAILEPSGAAQVTPSQCGITLPSMNTLIATTSLAGVTGYRFRITNMTDNTAPNQVQTIDRQLHWFSLPMLATFTYGTTYRIEVAVKTNGVYTGFGSPCNVTTPPVPVIDQCGATITSNNSYVSTASLQHANQYRFELTNMSTAQVTLIDNALNRFTFSQFAGYVQGGTYQVRVAVRTTGVWSLFGPSCTITAPGVIAASKIDDAVATPSIVAKAWPNPFAERFALRVENAQNNQSVKVYDMLGKLIETTTLAPGGELELGNYYPSGVYNLIIGSGEQARTLRVVKR